MQLEQNLFSIYRLILKTPKYICLLGLLFLLVIATVQLAFMFKATPPLELSQCIFEYIIDKHQRKVNQTFLNGNSSELVGSESNETKLQEIELVDDSTILSVVVGKAESCQYQIDSQYAYDKSDLPLLKLTKNEHLSFIKEKSKSYFQTHKIRHDKLIIPPITLSSPVLTYFFLQDMYKNEYLLQTLRNQIFLLDAKVTLYILANNITNIKLSMNQIYASYYYESEAIEYQKTINFLQYISLKLFNPLLLKLVYSVGVLIIMYLLSIFVGLLIRYTLFTLYTAFLLIYDRFMIQSWGWVHQYLIILYARLRQNYWATLKFIVFYFFSNIGMNGLLAFGSYCVIKKLLYPIMPLPIESYSDFLFKSFFFVELFLYVCCRSRVTLRFFPLFSFVTTFLCLTFIWIQEYGSVMMLLNLNLTFQLVFFIVFLLIEQAIQADSEKGLPDEYCPSMNKPRMLFYAGYDISWEKSLPPIWTYFTSWFDYSYFTQAEKSLMQKDYQLLYGRMLGLNQRQEIPEEDEEDSGQMRLNEQPSNEMNLIQNDL